MRVALVTPLPPATSGIADYSAALLEHLKSVCEVDPIVPGERKSPCEYDIALYQIGNNPDHEHAYRLALDHPGVVVLHEANLHHLVASITIRRNDWDSYLREVEFDSGAEALAFAHRVKRLETGPNYEGVPMLRRILSRARGVIAHSEFVLGKARELGFEGPAARIPHGAWLPARAHRMEFRERLGLGPDAVLTGIFGHLKPYKRIAESLRAFARVAKLEPRARMILVGEPHPELPLQPLLRALRLEESVRVVGRVDDIDEFTGYIDACDIVLNLRYPTVGETSGTLLRALGLGKAAIVSEVGAFAEFPDDVCLRVPVDAAEEQTLFSYLNLLVTRPDLARSLGASGRRWVEREASWELTARRYAEFLDAVATGREFQPASPAPREAARKADPVPAEYIQSWAENGQSRAYIDTHIDRLSRTLELTPPGTADDRVLEMGAYFQITPALQRKLGYGEVRGCYYGPAGQWEEKSRTSAAGEKFSCVLDFFDAGSDPFPYPDGHFATVLCCELIEHLPADPMHMMAEVNRILCEGGHLVLTTPNAASLRAISAILQGYHPGFFPAYLHPAKAVDDARHAREYTPKEIYQMFGDAGFTVTHLETGPFRKQPLPELHWVEHMLETYSLPRELRGEGIFCVGQKTGPVRRRFPEWLYS